MSISLEPSAQTSFNPLAPTPPEANLRSWGMGKRELGDTPRPSVRLRWTPSSVIPAEAGIQGSRGGTPIKGMIHHDSYGTPCDAPAGGLLLHLRTTGGTGEAKLARDAQTLQTHGRDQSLATYLVIPAEAGIQKAHHVVSAGLISSRMPQCSCPSPRWERGACTKKRGHASTWPLEAASQIAISRVIPSAVP